MTTDLVPTISIIHTDDNQIITEALPLAGKYFDVNESGLPVWNRKSGAQELTALESILRLPVRAMGSSTSRTGAA